MQESNSLEGVYKFVSYVVSTAVFITLGILFWTHQVIFWIFAVFVFACVTLVIFDFTARRVTRLSHWDIGETGSISQNMFGKVMTYSPRGISAPREATKTALLPAIPKVADLLREGLLDGMTLYHGYTIVKEEAQSVTGTFNDLRTFAIGGKGGSGKTVRLFFLLLQFILGRATIYLCDPHGEDQESITALMRPLARWVNFAVRDFQGDIEAQIMHAVVEFRDTMEARVHGDKDRSPRVLVIDEFTRILNHPEYGPIVVDVVCKCSTEYRKFQGYAVVLAQEWSAPGKGKVMNLLSQLRNDLHAVFIHRLNRNYAKFFLTDTKLLKRVDNLRPGQCFFLDAKGSEVQELFTPMGTVADAFTVARLMQQIEPPDEMLQIPRGYNVSPYTSQSSRLPLLEQSVVRSENMVSELDKPREERESDVRLTYHSEDEEAIFLAYAELLEEGKGEAITKTDIMNRLHEIDKRWNNKRWNVLKDICEKYAIA